MTAEEILENYIKKVSPFGTATVANPIVNKAMIYAMQEFSNQQNKELLSELSKQKELVEKANEDNLSNLICIDYLKQEIEALKKERDSISEINRKFIDDAILKATSDKDSRIKELEEFINNHIVNYSKSHLTTMGIQKEAKKLLSTPTKEEGGEEEAFNFCDNCRNIFLCSALKECKHPINNP